jgi:hypothetical protein
VFDPENLIAAIVARHRNRANREARAMLVPARNDRFRAVRNLGFDARTADFQHDHERGEALCCAIRRTVLETDEDLPRSRELADAGLYEVMDLAQYPRDLKRRANRILIAIDIGLKKYDLSWDQHTAGGCIEKLGDITARIALSGDLALAKKLLPYLMYAGSAMLARAALARMLMLQGNQDEAMALAEEPDEEGEVTPGSVFATLMIAAGRQESGDHEGAQTLVQALQANGNLDCLTINLESVRLIGGPASSFLLSKAADAVQNCDSEAADTLREMADTVENDEDYLL